MGKPNEKAEAPAKAETKSTEPKRTVLTPEQRVARLEAELAAARKKAEDKANKHFTQLREKRAKLVARRDDLTKQIDAIDAELPDTKDEAPADEAKAS